MDYLKPRSGEERALIENGQMHGALLHEQLLGDRHSTGRQGGICLMSRTALYNVPISKMRDESRAHAMGKGYNFP